MTARTPTQQQQQQQDEEETVPTHCKFCMWWEPGDGHTCTAYPAVEGRRIPDVIWSGQSQHFAPLGDEAREGVQSGDLITFEPYVDPIGGLVRTEENAALLRAYAEYRRGQHAAAGLLATEASPTATE